MLDSRSGSEKKKTSKPGDWFAGVKELLVHA
jgi:hypothetical protein